VQIGGATVTAPSDRLIRRIRRDFPRGTDDDVIQRLTALSPDDSSERLQAALVLGAAGKWNRFEQQLRRLERDWREVLVVGGLADEDWPSRLADALPGAPDPASRPGQADRAPGAAAPPRSIRRDASAPRRTVVRKQPRSPRSPR
jgi:hypothetical protein